MKVYLVRHAAACERRGQQAAEWHLSRDGRTAAGALAEEPLWRSVQGIHTSPEPKAQATAQRIAARHALPLRIEPEQREVERPWTAADYAAAVSRYLGGEALPGWEPRDAASARLHHCIDSIVARHKEMTSRSSRTDWRLRSTSAPGWTSTPPPHSTSGRGCASPTSPCLIRYQAGSSKALVKARLHVPGRPW